MSRDTSKDLESLVPFEFFPYASYAPGRTNGGASYREDFKRHKTLGQAKASIGAWNFKNNPNTKLYKYEGAFGQDGKWVELNE